MLHHSVRVAVFCTRLSLSLPLHVAQQKVRFEVEAVLEIADSQVDLSDADRDRDIAEFPSGLRIYCIDDSASARRLMHHNFTLRCQTTNVYSYGETEVCRRCGTKAGADQSLEDVVLCRVTS